MKGARTRLVRIVRGLRPDRNPLRRALDRAEVAIAAGLVLVFLVAAPLLSLTVSHWARNTAQHAELVERATSREVRAVLLHSAPAPILADRAISDMAAEPARWTAAHGLVRTGQVLVPGGTRAGTTLLVWTDLQGRLTSPPLMPSQVGDQTALAALLTPAALALALAAGWLVIRRTLNARRLAWWEAQWSTTGPSWTSRR
jgi:hypothetical protein